MQHRAAEDGQVGVSIPVEVANGGGVAGSICRDQDLWRAQISRAIALVQIHGIGADRGKNILVAITIDVGNLEGCAARDRFGDGLER